MKLVPIPFDGQICWAPADSSFTAILQRNEAWEPAVTRYLVKTLTPDLAFVDVGAHFGYYTLLAAKRTKHVIAFEPQEQAREILLKNVRENGYDNVTVSDLALFSRRTQGRIAKYTVHFEHSPDDGEVRATTLDHFLEGEQDRIRVIKVDTEGAEYDVLLGARRTLEAHSPTLILELHPGQMPEYFGYTTSNLLALLGRLGYNVKLMERGNLYLKWGPHLLCRVTNSG